MRNEKGNTKYRKNERQNFRVTYRHIGMGLAEIEPCHALVLLLYKQMSLDCQMD